MPYRILLPYVADRYGGSNESSLVMAAALRARGHQPIVLAHGRGRVIDEARSRGLEVVEAPRLSEHPSYERSSGFQIEQLRAAPSCYSAARRIRPTIVHTNDLTMLRTWALPARLAGARFVAHWRAASRVSLSVSAAFALADRVISVSAYSKAFLPPRVARKTDVEYNALEVFMTDEERSTARLAVRARLQVPPEAVLIGVFGNFSRRKRSHVLTDVVAALAQAPSGAPLFGLLCGGRVEPLDQELFAKIERYGLASRLLMPGFVRPVHEWMAACDVILAPAEKEPLARNVLEAQAVGVPVIVSSDGGLTELIHDGDNGIILPPDQIDRWIEAVRRVLEDPEFAARLARRGQESVRVLAPNQHAERIERIYDGIVGR